MSIADDSLCRQTVNAGEVNKSAGACCHIATVDNVNLLTGELTVSFTGIPPVPFATQIIVPGANVRYNCGLCYTSGLGNNQPAMGYERADSVLVLIPRGWVPENGADFRGLFVVGHEFAAGAEDLKACGQMGRMIIKPGSTVGAAGGYGTPFLEETVDDDGLPICVPVNPFLDPFLGTVGMGTINGGVDRHLMVYAGVTDLIAVRPYLFPNGPGLNGRLEHTNYVQDGMFAYGVRCMISEVDMAYSSGNTNVALEVKLQEPRTIGTSGNNYFFSTTLPITSNSTYNYACHISLSPPFGIDAATSDIFLHVADTGIVRYTATFDPAIPSLTYSASAKSTYIDESSLAAIIDIKRTIYTSQSIRRHTQAYGDYVEVKDYENGFYMPEVDETMYTLTNGVNSVTIVVSASWDKNTTGFYFFDTRGHSGDRYSSVANAKHLVNVYLNGVLLGTDGTEWVANKDVTFSPDYDGGNICGAANDDPPPLTPNVVLSTHLSATYLDTYIFFLYLDINKNIAIYITSECSDSVSQAITGPYPLVDREYITKLNICIDGVVTTLDTHVESNPATLSYTSDPSMPLEYNRHTSPGSPTVISSSSSSGTSWTTALGSSCTYSSADTTSEDQWYYDVTKYAFFNTNRNNQNFPGISIFDATLTKWQECPIRNVTFIGYGDWLSRYTSATPLFNEFAKSDDGNLMYFSVPKLAKLATAYVDDDFIRVLVQNGTVSTNAKEILEAATGLTHSQASMRFAPYR